MNQKRISEHTAVHPIIPSLYVGDWRNDMKNSKLLRQNANDGRIPLYDHDDHIFWKHREQCPRYNVEESGKILGKYDRGERDEYLETEMSQRHDKYRSRLMKYESNIKCPSDNVDENTRNKSTIDVKIIFE
ncbi:hypothetical protein SNEBB_006494 [Seison nebaliae]|nr:hypothetical protein SNEBB_006494 [Seison nebaliae]